MKRVLTISRGLIWAAAFLLALSACATVPEDTVSPATAAAEKARVLEQSGHHAEAARGYLSAAEITDSTQRAELLLKAAQAFYRARLNEQAKTTLQSLPSSGLTPLQLARRQNLIAAIAVTEQNPRAALDALKLALNADTPPEVRAETHRLRAAAYAQAGNILEAARERVALAPLLGERDAIRNNEEALWQSLIDLPQDTLQNLRGMLPPDALGGWVALALLAKNAGQGSVSDQGLNEWRQQYPQHPASAELLSTLSPPRAEGQSQDPAQPATRIALLLPLTGALAKPAEAVRDGFLAAYFQDPQNNLTRVKIYDTGDKTTNVPEIYARATADGADVVVGPLAKEGVAALKQIQLSVPTLALNYSDDSQNDNPSLFQFGLSPEQEAQEVAERAWLDGHAQALAIAPAGDWGNRVLQAFQQRWQQLGGRIVGSKTFEPNENDLSTPLRQLLNIDDSETRARALRAALQTDLKFEPRRRHDADFIFLAAFASQARQIPPQLKFFYAGDLPVYATSHVYEGIPDPAKDRDLDGVMFADMPWVLSDASDPLRAAVDQAWPNQLGLQRLYALGIDAYRLAPALTGSNPAVNNAFPGATGRLNIDNSQRIRRTLMWARFNKGEPALISVNPAPAAAER